MALDLGLGGLPLPETPQNMVHIHSIFQDGGQIKGIIMHCALSCSCTSSAYPKQFIQGVATEWCQLQVGTYRCIACIARYTPLVPLIYPMLHSTSR